MASWTIAIRNDPVTYELVEAATYVMPDGQFPVSHIKFYASPDDTEPVFSIALCDVISIRRIADSGK